MISKFYIENFRSIEKAEIDLGKITVLTGANNSGKSSVIYAMLVLRNFLANPNQSIENILVPAQINLGGFKETVRLKDESSKIILSFDDTVTPSSEEFLNRTFKAKYKFAFNKIESELQLSSDKNFLFNFVNKIALPYPINKKEFYNAQYEDLIFRVAWDGIDSHEITLENKNEIFPVKDATNVEKIRHTLGTYISYIPYSYNELDYVPLKRGVTKPFFNTVPITNQQYTEDEIATLLATDRDLEGKVALYMEKFTNKIFSVRFTPKTSNFYLQLRDKTSGFITDLVNEGQGVNQLVVLLAKILHKGTNTICIDEPEIHLHPSYINKLTDILVETSRAGEKQFVLSSHSEHLISSLLNNVAEGKLNKDDLKIYYLTKDGTKTNFELQPVNDKGQIEGGLKSFYESELNLAKDFFKTNN